MAITFKLTVLNANKLIFTGDVWSCIFCGVDSEFEVMAYHSPLVGVLRKGEIIINRKSALYIERGLVKFHRNECTVLAEEKGSDLEIVLGLKD